MSTAAIAITAMLVILVGGGIVTVAWWRIADRWADAEHKRFKPKSSGESDESDKPVVVTGFERDSRESRP